MPGGLLPPGIFLLRGRQPQRPCRTSGLTASGGAEYNEKNPGKKGKPNERKPKAPEGSPQGY